MRKIMQKNYAPFSVGLFEVRFNLTKILKEMTDKPAAIMDRGNIKAYLVPAATYEAMVEKLDELETNKPTEKGT